MKKEDEKLSSPVDGEVIQIESVKDPVFSTKAMGEGFAVIPKSNQIYAPISGVVETVFPTQHAIGIKGDNGLEVLVHIGINTVELNGKYFDISCVAGSRVTKGMIIGEVDFKALQAAGYDSTTMVVVTNGNELSEPVKFDIKEIHLAGGAV